MNVRFRFLLNGRTFAALGRTTDPQSAGDGVFELREGQWRPHKSTHETPIFRTQKQFNAYVGVMLAVNAPHGTTRHGFDPSCKACQRDRAQLLRGNDGPLGTIVADPAAGWPT